MDRILACIDSSPYAASVCRLAGWAARRVEAEVELLHVLQRTNAAAQRSDLSGAIGLGVKSELLEELTRIDEAQGKLAIKESRVLLDAAEERLRDAGIAAVTKTHRHGGIVETIIEREEEARLVVIGKRGASSSFAADHLGSKIERVVRSSSRPVLVAPREVTEIDRAVIAFDGSASARRALDEVACSRLFEGLDLEVVMAGQGPRDLGLVEEGAAVLKEAGRTATTSLVDGKPERVIAERAAARPGTLLVMGAYGHSPIRTLIVGSTTTEMVRTVGLPVLLVR